LRAAVAHDDVVGDERGEEPEGEEGVEGGGEEEDGFCGAGAEEEVEEGEEGRDAEDPGDDGDVHARVERVYSVACVR
jgi:hypothetical protein